MDQATYTKVDGLYATPFVHNTYTMSLHVQVYAYSVEYGRVLGSFTAHDDTVSCLQLLHSPSRLLTASWDGSVKLWRYNA